MTSYCRSCDAPIEWAWTQAGKRMPIDDEPSEDGNVLVWREGNSETIRCKVLGPLEVEELRGDEHGTLEELYTSHFATCAFAKDWRRR